MSGAGVATFHPGPRRDTGWQENAACIGLPSEFFFPERSAVITVGARKVCDDCPVRDRCLEYALTEGEWHGIWGGLSPEQRRDLARTRRETRRRKAVGA
jgi:WhiB family redox-sensing transcriptional regulator